MITASKPGDDNPKVDKRYDESLLCSVDLKTLLDTNEIVTSTDTVEDAGLSITKVRSREGTKMEFLVGPSDLGTSTNMSHLVRIRFNTNFGSTKSLVILVKVHK